MIAHGRSQFQLEMALTPHRHRLGVFAARDGQRLRHDLLASPSRLAGSRRLGQGTPRAARTTATGRRHRLVSGRGRQRLGACGRGGEKTGPNPTDRRKKGSKHHIVTDANGIPLAATLTGANRHDVTQLIPLVDAIPTVKGRPGRPRRRPSLLYADRAYDSHSHRMQLWARRIAPQIAHRNTEHGSSLGKQRWVVERTISWLHQNRRLRIRYERRADIHEAFVTLGCILICHNFLNNSLC